jgi:hypothetical protein
VPASLLPYETWIEEALRGVIQKALAYTAERGLVGNHHFYITFTTGSPGVDMPDWLRAQYPEEMTIVLQHQFWGLAVDDAGFSVSLRFHGRAADLRVPFSAVQAFGDPGVNFGLQLHALPKQGGGAEAAAAAEAARVPPGALGDDSAGDRADHDGESATGEVIALDRFRKK